MGELGLAFIKLAKFETRAGFTPAHAADAKCVATGAVKASIHWKYLQGLMKDMRKPRLRITAAARGGAITPNKRTRTWEKENHKALHLRLCGMDRCHEYSFSQQQQHLTTE
ncbi:unnamed protein product [Sphagnum troendelagicum]|uniref:Uncharacterized protein n=1 Tax=Sphagnum troendelagicum TaxID=128251 RepID=A0ABP0UBQ6_9BRYO